MCKLVRYVFIAVAIGGTGYLGADTSPPTTTGNAELFSIKQRFIEWMLTDQKFVDKVIESSRLEIEASKLAMQKSDNAKIINFAKKMVDDHSKASEELKEIAQSRGLKIPQAMSDENANNLKKLTVLNDEQFDLAYIDMMKKEHERDESLFVAASAHTALDTHLQSFAQKNLTLIRDHIGHVKSLGTVEISSPN